MGSLGRVPFQKTGEDKMLSGSKVLATERKCTCLGCISEIESSRLIDGSGIQGKEKNQG